MLCMIDILILFERVLSNNLETFEFSELFELMSNFFGHFLSFCF